MNVIIIIIIIQINYGPIPKSRLWEVYVSSGAYGTNPTAPYNQSPPQSMNNFGPPPQQTSMTTVVVTQPQQVKHDMMVASLQGHRDWSTGLFECFQDMGVCKFSVQCIHCVHSFFF
jgi:hypothetical protein